MAEKKTRTETIREQQRNGGEGVTAVMVSRIGNGVRDDIWTSFPNIHLRVLDAERGGIEIQICDCGMSGHCKPQAWARIEKHNRNRLAAVITLEEQP